ncbi:MAG TPA: amidase [Thermoleophilia bacterium]|nr:amidase [Thermoleophilia bacterium]
MTALNELSATALRQGYLRRQFSPVEVLEAVAARAERTRPHNAFVTFLLDAALEKARLAELLYLRGEADSRPLLGVPIAVKDNYDMAQIRTTYGSSLFADHFPRESAECVRRVEAAGAIVVGKTSMHEFAWGITGENPHFGPCRNPWDFARIAGGSSSGSAAAVALMVTPIALGSDTAGSIRIPASLCGIFGMKPSYDRLPRSGLFPLAPTLDHVGLMAREPGDLAVLLKVTDDVPRACAGTDLDEGVDPGRGGALHGVRVGVLPTSSYEQLDGDLEDVVRATCDVLTSLGAEVAELDPGIFVHTLGTFAPIQQAEAYFVHHARDLFPARGSEYGGDVRARLELAKSVTLADYLAGTTARDALRARMGAVFETVDFLLTPLGAARTPTLASLLDGDVSAAFRKLMLTHTVPQSLAGIPACAVRGGFDRDGLPVGIQFSAPRGADERLLLVVDAFYRSTPAVQEKWPTL